MESCGSIDMKDLIRINTLELFFIRWIFTQITNSWRIYSLLGKIIAQFPEVSFAVSSSCERTKLRFSLLLIGCVVSFRWISYSLAKQACISFPNWGLQFVQNPISLIPFLFTDFFWCMLVYTCFWFIQFS